MVGISLFFDDDCVFFIGSEAMLGHLHRRACNCKKSPEEILYYYYQTEIA